MTAAGGKRAFSDAGTNGNLAPFPLCDV